MSLAARGSGEKREEAKAGLLQRARANANLTYSKPNCVVSASTHVCLVHQDVKAASDVPVTMKPIKPKRRLTTPRPQTQPLQDNTEGPSPRHIAETSCYRIASTGTDAYHGEGQEWGNIMSQSHTYRLCAQRKKEGCDSGIGGLAECERRCKQRRLVKQRWCPPVTRVAEG